MTPIPPEKARKFLRAAVLGMVDQGISLAEAKRTLIGLYCSTAVYKFGSIKQAAAAIDTCESTIVKRRHPSLRKKST